MPRLEKRVLVLTLVLAVCAVGAFLLQYSRPANKAKSADLTRIPLNISGWQAEDAPVDKITKDILETDAVLIRKYAKGEQSLWVSIVYYKDSRVALHLPESCSIGAGSFIAKKSVENIAVPKQNGFTANKLILKGNKGNQVILYYFETLGLKTDSYQGMRWRMMMNKLKGRSNSGALIRFSTANEGDAQKATGFLKQFMSEAAPVLSKYMFGK